VENIPHFEDVELFLFRNRWNNRCIVCASFVLIFVAQFLYYSSLSDKDYAYCVLLVKRKRQAALH
jgi:hypothetical protein